jgi:hypothetical protein
VTWAGFVAIVAGGTDGTVGSYEEVDGRSAATVVTLVTGAGVEVPHPSAASRPAVARRILIVLAINAQYLGPSGRRGRRAGMPAVLA